MATSKSSRALPAATDAGDRLALPGATVVGPGRFDAGAMTRAGGANSSGIGGTWPAAPFDRSSGPVGSGSFDAVVAGDPLSAATGPGGRLGARFRGAPAAAACAAGTQAALP